MRAFVLLGLLISTSAQAGETITYNYDALGRLVQVSRAGTVNNGATAAYTYDPANNRTNVTTTAPGGGGMAQAKPAEPAKDPAGQRGAGNAAPRP